jgi:hypothetical protein
MDLLTTMAALDFRPFSPKDYPGLKALAQEDGALIGYDKPNGQVFIVDGGVLILTDNEGDEAVALGLMPIPWGEAPPWPQDPPRRIISKKTRTFQDMDYEIEVYEESGRFWVVADGVNGEDYATEAEAIAAAEEGWEK